MPKELYYNTGKLTRFILRRDRIRIPIWLIAITLITLIIVPAFSEMYPSQIERQGMAATMENPAMTAMVGPGYGLDNYTVGAMMAHMMLLFTALAVAIMSILLVSRHTRLDEEEGRIEMIRSLPVGRLSNLASTTIVSIITNIILAIIVGFGLYALGIESMDLNGSILYGVVLGATGIFFTSITALFVQLSSSDRGAIGFSFTFLGLAYLVRAIGDISSETLARISPLGLVLRTEVYVNNYWWPILIVIVESLIILAFAYYLNSIRDLEAGFIPAKPGRKTASSFLQSLFGLGLRLQRTAIISWFIGMFILGVSYGSVFGDLESFFETNEMIQQILPPGEGLSLTEQFLTMLMAIISMICTIPALIMVLKIKGEEKRNRTEHLLARAVSRNHIMGNFLAISIIVGFISLFLAVIGLWSAASAVMDDPIAFSTMFKAAMVYLPAMWGMVGLAALLIGLIPKLTGLTWLYLGYSFFVVYLGDILQVPEWMTKLSPFGHVPKIPIDDMNFTIISVLTLIAASLVAIGFIGYNKRDIQG
ncbi:ABC transporter permease [Clostridium sp. D2Q-14]|uniref:ABC transporter permease n=1 Tax=Anaeromonas gelatinilytica TaxID=2683194 RepID=UPI00193C2053|nr:ABC transporter permease [Anaeromonas gelatinilytica]MBS4535070.1 ABC transporter permease [Anaeromonas gelatinilytica]